MKLWLASYPRSGNTFFRNILHDCYSISSSTFDTQIEFRKYVDYESFDVVKTHELFELLPPHLKDIPKVYILRDGRDAIVSQAYQMINYKKSTLAPYLLMIDMILSKDNSHYGGWSSNVESWSRVSDVIIKFEDLILKPIDEVSRIKDIYNLPNPELDNIPSFQSQKNDGAKYGNPENKFQHFFRKGIPGSWREDMPMIIQDLFWKYHGNTMSKYGYTFDNNYKNVLDDKISIKKNIIKYLVYGKPVDKHLYKILLNITINKPIYFLLSLYYIIRELLYSIIK
jgi:hypothetical protein